MQELLTVAFSDTTLFKLNAKYSNRVTKSRKSNHTKIPLKPGPCFDLAKRLSLLRCPKTGIRLVHVIVFSTSNANNSDRFFHSLEQSGIEPGAMAFVTDNPVPYLQAYNPHLFLSDNQQHVRAALNASIPAAFVYPSPKSQTSTPQIRIAFDGDCVLFTDESEKVFASCPENGLAKFIAYEVENAHRPMQKGPLYPFLMAINSIQSLFTHSQKPFRISLVTARSFPTHSRPLISFRKWGVTVDDVFFMNGRNKSAIVKAFNPHIFFDDQHKHCSAAQNVVQVAQVFNDTTKNSTGT